MRTPLVLLSATLCTGCQVLSLPPASSRADGGPVTNRGVISHEARSQLRLYRDAAGCESVQTVNRQFRLVTVVTEKGPERLVLEEAYDVRHCLTAESVSSEATVTAWRPDSGASQPVYRISGRGSDGDPDGNLYGMSLYGCCGSQNLTTYYSLINGASLFSSSTTVIRLEGANDHQVRFAAFHDTFSAGTAGEAAADSTVIGVLQWGDDRTPARRLTVRADHPEAFAVYRVAFVKDGKEATDSILTVWPGKPAALGLAVHLTAPSSDRSVAIVVPIKGYDLDPAHADLPKGVRLTAEK